MGLLRPQDRTLWDPGSDFLDLGWIQGLHWFGHIGAENVYSVMLVSRIVFLMTVGSQSSWLGLENKVLGISGTAKSHFRRSWISHDPRVQFCMILGGVWTHLHDFCCLVNWLEVA